jgi:hypothetical protein
MYIKTLIDISAGIRLPQLEQEIFACNESTEYYLNKLCGQYYWYAEGNSNACNAHYYAAEVVRGRWPEAEPVIVKDGRWAYLYARYVINGRWPEAEAAIAQGSYYRNMYNSIFGTSI